MLVRHAAQGAVEAVGPCVIAAGQRLLAPCPVHELHAAMPAGVAERAHDPVAAAHRDDRRQRRLARHIGADLGQRRGRTERRRRAPKHFCDLRVQPVLRGVMHHRFVPDRIAHVGRLVVDMVEDARDERAIVGQGCGQGCGHGLLPNAVVGQQHFGRRRGAQEKTQPFRMSHIHPKHWLSRCQAA